MSAFFDPADYLERDPQRAATKVEARRLWREAEQRAKLCHNMTKVAARRGLGSATIEETMRIGGLGRGTFYKHYATPEECLLEAFKRCADTALARVEGAAAQGEGNFSSRLEAGLGELLHLLGDSPEVARLLLVEILAGDRDCRRARERWLGRLAGLLACDGRASGTPQRGSLAWLAAAAIASALARWLDRGDTPPRGQMLEELVGVGLWPRRVEAGLRTERTVDDRRHESIEAGPRRHGAARRARAREAQRARILAAMTETAGTKGYRAARVADVLERAGLSTSEFYSLFAGKQECLLAAFEVELKRITERVRVAVERKATCAGKAEVGLRALVESLAERPAAARTVMIEVRVSGDRGEGRHVEALSSLTYLIGGPRSAWQADGAHEVARMVAEGLADMIASEVGEGRAAQPEELLPRLVFTALAPYLGGEEAAERASAVDVAQAR